MCDFFDDFDDFGENGFMDNDSFEDSFNENLDMDEAFTGDTELDDEPIDAEKQDDDLRVDPFILGAAMGFFYEEGLREGKKRKRKKFSDDPD